MQNDKRINFINPETMPPTFGYTHAVEVRNARTIYVSGQVALNREGQVVGTGDLAAQTKQVFDNIQFALEASGVSFEHVVKLTFFVTDISKMHIVREIRDQYVNTETPPASSAVEVSKLIRDELLIEIEAIAVADI
ncbi:RidA family protein [Brevibacillus sp. HB1.2]|uniref:RidA family protein n=1 Tax=Brevibacillus TaxID=55080 RepID=UPI0008534D12|nr:MULTISPECIES: RidA family protein [unclassified Brevibacillus]MDC0764570.1 RidA family protein [Brevibacillus sp. AG]NRS20717.1 RidA family protein [Brevibacillus sp. HB1.4B]NTU24453.1 RidA family protein [Brevibacillus sp. HB1.2]NTU34335.1 RidA family protein [Brevibacillus sp. HB1.1]